MQRFVVMVSALVVLGGVGCGSQAAQGAPAEAPAAEEQPALTQQALEGLWVEFWAVAGHTDTQRYAFFPDGRFGWCAASSAQGPTARRFGRVSLQAGGTELLLSVEGQAERSCETSACLERFPAPVEERLVIGACPPNEEARAIDANYRCVSLGGQAFWRHAHHTPAPSEFLLD